VQYWRTYVIRKEGGGFYPVDAGIGLTGDGFSPLVMSLATRLATRVSFAASVLLFRCFYGWAPSSETLQELIIGMGKESGAYMDQASPSSEDGDILEAVRKPSGTVVCILSSIRAVMKGRMTTGFKSVQHKMNIANL